MGLRFFKIPVLFIISVLISGPFFGICGPENIPRVKAERAVYEVFDYDGLNNIRNDLNGEYIFYDTIDASITSTLNDGAGWEPIGTPENPFTGILRQEYDPVIRGLTINRPNSDYIGLFGYIGSEAQITGIRLEELSIIGKNNVGGLAGENAGNIINSSTNGSITSQNDGGGVVGKNSGTIENSTSSATVTGSSDTGGVVGINGGTIRSSQSVTGTVTGVTNAGGLVGFASTTSQIEGSSSSADVEGTTNVGGLAGQNQGLVSTSKSSGIVSGTTSVGGLVGFASEGSTIEKSSSSASANGTSKVGGLVGQNDDVINDCYVTGSISATGDYSGGLVGYIDSASAISRTYSIGIVSGADFSGGLIGYINVPTSVTVEDSFWDVEASGLASSVAGTAKTTLEMKNVSTYTDLYTVGLNSSWDFLGNPNDDNASNNIWTMMPLINNYYPFLAADTTTFFPLNISELEAKKPAVKPNIVFMNDFAADYDGEFGLLMLAYLKHIGYANIAAAISDSALVQSKYVIDAILSSYGINDVPIGVYNYTSASGEGERDGYHPGQIDSLTMLRNSYGDSTPILRRALADATEPITLLTNGPLTSLYALMQSGPNHGGDNIDLSGIELISQKVAKFVCGSGYYFKQDNPSNFKFDAVKANYVISTWNAQLPSIPIYYVGEDASDGRGRNINTGNWEDTDILVGQNIWPTTNPAHYFWGTTLEGEVLGDSGYFGEKYAEAHDLIRTYYAVFADENGETEFLTKSVPGLNSVSIASNTLGVNTFIPNDSANSYFIWSPVDATDMVNLVSRIAYSSAYIDLESPTTTSLVSPNSPDSNGWYKASAPIISLIGDDQQGMGVGKIYYKWHADDAYSEYSRRLIAPEGNHTLYYYSIDRAGHQEVEPNTISLKVDINSPNIIFDDPATINVTTSSSTYVIRGRMNDYGSGLEWVRINNIPLPIDSEEFAVNVNLVNGLNTFIFTSADKIGNIGTTFAYITRTETPIIPTGSPPPSIRDIIPNIFSPLSETPLSTTVTANPIEATTVTANPIEAATVADEEVANEVPTDTFSVFDGSDYQTLGPARSSVIIYSRNPVFKGKTIPNAKVILEIHSDETIFAETTSDSGGNWEYQVDKELSPGEHSIKITIKDSQNKIVSENGYKFIVEKLETHTIKNQVWPYLLFGICLLVMAIVLIIKRKRHLLTKNI